MNRVAQPLGIVALLLLARCGGLAPSDANDAARTAPSASSVNNAARTAPSASDVQSGRADRTEPGKTTALKVERRITVRQNIGSEVVTVTSRSVSWQSGGRRREESEAMGVIPANTSVWTTPDGWPWIVDDASKVAAPVDPPDPAGARMMVATDFGLDASPEGEIALVDPLFKEDKRDARPSDVIAGEGRSFVRRTAKLESRLWVVAGLEIGARDYADAFRRKIPRPHTQADEAFFAALESLPGYPVDVETSLAGGKVVLRNTVLSVTRETIDEDKFTIPPGYARLESGTQVLLKIAITTRERERKEGRAKLGLDAPFEPTQSQPLPPPLPGGSCKPDPAWRRPAAGCREAWDGRETNFAVFCVTPFNFEKPCSRKGLVGVCESSDRSELLYYYASGGKAACDGRWYEAP